ncbi:MAG: hypothetical protein RL065_917 [Bacteroidota bacterium]|jgi:predicted AAA+ superfamily ATPase
MYNRKIITQFTKHFFKGVCIVLIGPRQVGKTTLVNALQSESSKKTIYFNCDEPDVKRSFENVTSTQLKNLISDNELIIIDEAQRVENIGVTLKLLVDNFKKKQFIVTGSSALEIADKIFEPLTGRQLLFKLYPLCLSEIYENESTLTMNRELDWHLIYGCYPKIVTEKESAQILLKNLAGQYLYKDILSWKDIRKPDLLDKLLHLLALQMCSEISLNELATQLKVNTVTIDNYIDLLEKSGVVYRLKAYSTNERKEVTKMKKIYFWDNGIRNAIIGNFDDVKNRNDVAALWENFIITERIKMNQYNQSNSDSFFWRSNQQQEIDYVEFDKKKLHAFEFKWNPNAKGKPTKAFTNLYPDAEVSIINNENYQNFVGI